MAGRQKNDTTIQFLIYSFIGLLIFSIVIFSILGIYMSQKSRKAVYKVGEIYMSGMNEQMSRHFETVIKLRFDQVSGIVSVVSTDNNVFFQENGHPLITNNLNHKPQLWHTNRYIIKRMA